MPRGSRHKSSRHGSRDAKDSSDSDNDSSLRDRKGKESGGIGRALKDKDSAASEKRRIDSKDTKELLHGSGNHNTDVHGIGLSKRRKERYDEGTNDRWNGGSDDEFSVRSKKTKMLLVDSKSKRREESVGLGLQCDGDELKKSSGKSEGRYKDKESSRKEGRNDGAERERERERKGREGRSDRVVVSEEHRLEKQVKKNTENVLQSPGPENHLETRVRRRAGSFDGDKPKDDAGDVENSQLCSKNDALKDGRRRSERHKDERNKEKYWEDAVDRDSKLRDDKIVKDHISRLNDRDLRDEKEAMGMRHNKRNRPEVSDPNQELPKVRVREVGPDAMQDQDHDRDRQHAYERDRDQESRRGRDRDRGQDRDRSRNRSRSHARDHYFDYEYDFDHDGSHLEDQDTKYIDSRGKKRSPNDHDDSFETRSKSLKNSHHSSEEKKSLSNDKVDLDAERGRSQSRSRPADGSLSSRRRKSSPSSMSRVSMDEYRYSDQRDLRDRYPKKEERSKSISSRDQSVVSGIKEKGSKYSYVEQPNEADGSHATELLRERSFNSKIGQNIDIEESVRRRSSSIDAKEQSSNKDRLSWDFSGEKPSVDDSSQAESAFYSKASQSNPSSFHPRPSYRAGVDISFDGSVEDDGRLNSNNSRFRRSGDPNLGRAHGNAWRGVPNWTTPLPNGFIPFQHGPPHGGFQAILPPFPAPPLFGIRPPLEITHSGIPYRMPDAERFSNQLHPLSWPNMLDGSSPSHLHVWDGNNGIFRDDSHIYNGSEWDENRQMVNGRGWESRADMWKRQSGSVKRELPTQFQKDDHAVQDSIDDVSNKEVYDESCNAILTKTAEMATSIPSSAKESPISPELLSETPAPLERSKDDNSKLSCVYLSKFEISADLAHPDLYHQCRRLVDTEHSATANEETAVCIILEGGARAVSTSTKSVHQSLLHPIKNSLFQRAMDIYKKQIMEMKEMQKVSRGKLDGILASSEGRLEEQALNFNEEKSKVPISTVDVEMTQLPISTTDDKAIETTDDKAVDTIAAASEKLEDLVSTASEEVQDLEKSEESLPIFNSTAVDTMASEQPLTIAGEGVLILPSDDVLMIATDASTNDVEIKVIGNGNDSTERCEDGNACFENAVTVSGPLPFSDEIADEACEGLMPVSGSIDSESLILSRIHHSPESTR